MQEANDNTVLGNFRNATFRYFGITSTFFKKDGKFFVRTDGPDGTLQEFEIAYTFGVRPLQQYLVRFPRGRFQALTICWDTRPKAEGGQRWFHLYPDEFIRHDDILHWTKPSETWNFMCAECHSTGLRKNYDLSKDAYATTWFEIDVSCEECHGPGSNHVAWAKEGNRGGKGDPAKGLVAILSDPVKGNWVPRPGGQDRPPDRSPLLPRPDGHLLPLPCTEDHDPRPLGRRDAVPRRSHAPGAHPGALSSGRADPG